MAVTISYDSDSKLIFHGLQCPCPCEHRIPSQDVYLGAGLIARVADYINKRAFGKKCVLVTDNVLYPLFGQKVEQTLLNAGFSVTLCVIKREGKMEPDETAVGEILLSITHETDFLISVGSGSLTDATRINAMRCRLPFVCVATAPSMDGYTSAISPLLLRGVKIHRDAVCPDIIVCDLDILRTAPMDMVCSGVGDVLGKFIADADYRLGHIVNDEPYCHTCGEMCVSAATKVLANLEAIKQRSEEGIRALTEALLVTGLSVLIIGHTRCVSSMEHNTAHYWEMMQLYRGQIAPAHGASVGVATLLVLPIFKRFMNEDVSLLDEDAIIAARPSDEAVREWILHSYGDEAGNALIKDNPLVFLPEDIHRARIRRVKERFPLIKETFAALPECDTLYGALSYLGAPLTSGALNVPDDMRNLSLHCAKDYRARYTLFKTLHECGLLAEYLSDYPLYNESEK